MAQYITDLKVSLNEDNESELREQGYKKLPGNLNAGTGGWKTYLWYKKGENNAITRIQFSFTDKMSKGLSDAGYVNIGENLNAGTCGDRICLWFYRGSTQYDVAITGLDVALNVDAEAAKYKAGWQRLACDLNRNAGGNRIYLFVKREKPVYVCDITATADFEEDVDKFREGYIRVDENTNRNAGGRYIFIWYRLTTDEKQAIKGPLEVSIDDKEYQNYQAQDYTLVSQDLNEGTGGNQVFLWYKKDGPDDPIRDVSVITSAQAHAFRKVGVSVISKNLNEGNKGLVEYVCYAELKAAKGDVTH